jgi:predicted nucleic acid-binding protein
MIVVADNSPLQYLALIDCDHVLPTLYGRVLTTPQVVAELSQPRTPDKVSRWIASKPHWLAVQSPLQLPSDTKLDIGEASAIALAQECGAELLLIDERAGTLEARRLGLSAVGTLGVLIEAAVVELIPFDGTIDTLRRQTSFFASQTVFDAARAIYRSRMKQP